MIVEQCQEKNKKREKISEKKEVMTLDIRKQTLATNFGTDERVF